MLDFYRNLSSSEWASLVPFGVACVALGFGMSRCWHLKKAHVNLCVNKSESKVVHSMDMEDLGNQTAFCRCWRSSKFPYCDGSHNKHNIMSGDNVGPLIIKKKD